MFNTWIRKIPWRRARQPTLLFLPQEFHGQRNLAGCRTWGHKELDATERLTHTQAHTHAQTDTDTHTTWWQTWWRAVYHSLVCLNQDPHDLVLNWTWRGIGQSGFSDFQLKHRLDLWWHLLLTQLHWRRQGSSSSDLVILSLSFWNSQLKPLGAYYLHLELSVESKVKIIN